MTHRHLFPVSLIALALSLFAGSAELSNARTIVIDPGHGGHDRGGIPGQRVSEKALALDTALRLRHQLQAKGYTVVMTRTTDVFIPLATRTAIANKHKGALFVSVHYNSARRATAQGFETFFYSRSSASLAYRIQRSIIRTARTDNRGIKRRGFYVLRNTRIPAVLVECGFLTNRAEAKRCLNPSYRQSLAVQMATAIDEHWEAGRRQNEALTASILR